MSNNQRKAFEDWFYNELSASSGAEHLAWQAWQAALELSVVELPKGNGDETGWVVSLTEVEDALDAVGVKYK